ncbi:MAG: FKBP-type peptidyl-prolyl cis-trans isomerase [Hyphomonadaceae bacterium]
MKKLFAAAFVCLALAACGRPSSVSEELDKQDKAATEERAQVIAESESFLAANKAKPGVKTTASGLQYEVVRAGDVKAPPPGPADTVTVMYEGTLPNGKVFDSSYRRGEPARFQVGGVIPGWTEALQLMHPGGEFRLALPTDIGYGPEGAGGGEIPGHSALVFRVELLGYVKPNGQKVGAP